MINYIILRLYVVLLRVLQSIMALITFVFCILFAMTLIITKPIQYILTGKSISFEDISNKTEDLFNYKYSPFIMIDKLIDFIEDNIGD